MKRPTLLAVSGIVGGLLAIAAAVLLPQSDEEKILATLEELVDAASFQEPISNPLLHGTKFAADVEPLVTQQVSFFVPSLGRPRVENPDELAIAYAHAASSLGSLDLSLRNVDVQVADGGQATATVVAVFDRGGSLQKDERRVQFTLERDGDSFRVSEVTTLGTER